MVGQRPFKEVLPAVDLNNGNNVVVNAGNMYRAWS